MSTNEARRLFILIPGAPLHHPDGTTTRSTCAVRETVVEIFRNGVRVGQTRSMSKTLYGGEEHLLYEADLFEADLVGLPRTREGFLITSRLSGAMWIRGLFPLRMELDPGWIQPADAALAARRVTPGV